MKIIGAQERDVPAIGRVEVGRVYNVDDVLGIDLVRQGVAKPYVDVLDGKDRPVTNIVHQTDSLALDSRLGSDKGE